MLLRLDLITKYGMDISIRESKLIIGLHEVPLHFGTKSQDAEIHQINRVTVQVTTVVPPNCIKRVDCSVEGDMEHVSM